MGIRCNSGRSLIDDHRLERLLQAICRHPWARFGLLQLESGLTEYQARAARKQALEEGMIETLRVATKGQPRPPRRYGLTPVGAYQARIPIPPINRRAEQLLAAGHLETVRTGILGGAPVRRRLVWAISPWRAAPNLTLDALTCVRGRGGVPVLIAFAAAPSTANPAWWYVELRRCWIRFRNARRDMEVGLAIVGAPFEARGLPTLAGPRPGRRGGRRQRPSPVYILRTLEYGSAINSPEKWERVPSSGSASCCPWDDPTFAPCTVPAGSFLDGRIPSSPRRQPLSAWAETSTHPAAPGLRASLSMTHAQAALVPALLRYPAFASAELAGLLEIRKRTVIRGLRQLSRLDLCECLPLFKREQRFVLTDRGIDLLAYQSMQTPSRFRSRRAWPSAHEPFTAFPRHMRYILAFMFALQRQGRLLEWDLVHARFAYTVAAAPADLVRPRRIELVPDSSGVLSAGKLRMPFWLEIDRGTRTGKKLVRQLEKYVLARFGDAASAPIPLLLYVVAEGGEARARLVARRLVELASRYRLVRAPAILITTWELLVGEERTGQPQPLRAVWRLPFRWREFVKPVIPAGHMTGCSDASIRHEQGGTRNDVSSTVCG